MEPTKTLIRAAVALFAAVVGFGMKALLDVTSDRATDVYQLRWALFGLLFLLAFRVICGASVHLADVYTDIKRSDRPIRIAARLTYDITQLMLFAAALLWSAYATSVDQFFLSYSIAVVILLSWSAIDGALGTHPLSGPFFGINALLFLLTISAWDMYVQTLPSVDLETGWPVMVLWLLAASALLAIVDIYLQMDFMFRSVPAESRSAASLARTAAQAAETAQAAASTALTKAAAALAAATAEQASAADSAAGATAACAERSKAVEKSASVLEAAKKAHAAAEAVKKAAG